MASQISHVQVAARLLLAMAPVDRPQAVRLALAMILPGVFAMTPAITALRASLAAAWDELAGHPVPFRKLRLHGLPILPHRLGRNLRLVEIATEEVRMVIAVEAFLQSLHHAVAPTLALWQAPTFQFVAFPTAVSQLNVLIEADLHFGAFYGDLPWRFDPQSDNPDLKQTIERFKRLPVRQLAAANSHCHIWAPVTLIPQATDILDAWDFVYLRTSAWIDGGLGYYGEAIEPDVALISGTRGRSTALPSGAALRRAGDRWSLNQPQRMHAAIERMSPPRFLELFAQYAIARPLWTAWMPSELNDDHESAGDSATES